MWPLSLAPRGWYSRVLWDVCSSSASEAKELIDRYTFTRPTSLSDAEKFDFFRRPLLRSAEAGGSLLLSAVRVTAPGGAASGRPQG